MRHPKIPDLFVYLEIFMRSSWDQSALAAFYDYKRSFGQLRTSVTRLGNLMDFGQLFKALGNKLICPNLQDSFAISVKVSKSLIFLSKSFLGKFHRHLVTFNWSYSLEPRLRQVNFLCANDDEVLLANTKRFLFLSSYNLTNNRLISKKGLKPFPSLKLL